MSSQSEVRKQLSKLMSRIVWGGARREELYDRLYSLEWGETTTNNYGFAPAEGIMKQNVFNFKFIRSCLNYSKTKLQISVGLPLP